jgi:hypothetical protein
VTQRGRVHESHEMHARWTGKAIYACISLSLIHLLQLQREKLFGKWVVAMEVGRGRRARGVAGNDQ